MEQNEKIIALLSILVIILTFILFAFALVAIDIRRDNFILRNMVLEVEKESIELLTQCILEPLPKLKSKPKPKPKPRPKPRPKPKTPGIRV